MSNPKHTLLNTARRRSLPSTTRKTELLHAAAGGDVGASGGLDEAGVVPARRIRRRSRTLPLVPASQPNITRSAGSRVEFGPDARRRASHENRGEIPVRTAPVETSSHSLQADSQDGGVPSEPTRDVLVEAPSLEEAIAAAVMRAMGPDSRPGGPDGGTLRLQSLPRAVEPSERGEIRGSGPVVAFRPGPETVQAIITAAAIIACADGQVSDLERRSLLDFLRRKGILEREGRAAATAAFDQAVALAVKLGLDEACAAADSFRALAERPGAPLVVHAATLVALADGVGWPQELALLEVIRDRLGLRVKSQSGAGDVVH